jgi:hypothetical protein
MQHRIYSVEVKLTHMSFGGHGEDTKTRSRGKPQRRPARWTVAEPQNYPALYSDFSILPPCFRSEGAVCW